MAEPITKVYGEDGELVHDCVAAGCAVSWDGYVLEDGYLSEQPDPQTPGAVVMTPLEKGNRVPAAADPGDAWDVSTPGVARLKPAAG